MARGHKIDNIPEVPLVVTDAPESYKKTSDAVKMLKTLGAYADVEKVKDSRKIRTGKGKMRNRRHVQRRGPLVIFHEDKGIVKAFRNIPGIELCDVSRLNLLELAPGGHLGRFCIWTKSAFEKLDQVYGTQKQDAVLKAGYRPPRPMMTNAELARIINSEEVQSALRPKAVTKRLSKARKNPLTNAEALKKLSPYAKMQMSRRRAAAQAAARARKD